MKTVNTDSKNNGRVRRPARTFVAALLAFCLVFGAGVSDSAVYAASEFKKASPFSNVKSTYYHNGRFKGDLIVNGVDISDWQSDNCNFKKAKKAGVDYAIMRVTYTCTGRWKKFTMKLDSNFSKQYANAKKNGVMTGVYVFSQAKNATEAKKEAKYAVKRLKALGIGPEDLNLPVYMDYEFSGGVFGRLYGLKKKNATNAAVAFCNTIKSYGYTPGIYANTTFFRGYLDQSRFASDVDLWCAQYYSRCESSSLYSKWQYSSSARINGMLYYTGVKGNIDVNFWYLDKTVPSTSLLKICGRTTLSVADAKAPKFKIYNNKTLLKEGVDYNVGGIRNNKKGKAYAYIKGIGKYGGYALVPITVAAETSGSVNKNLSAVAANYLTNASTEKSSYLSTSASSAITYKKGTTYTVQTALNIRKGAGTKYGKVKRADLSDAMKKKTYSGTYAVLMPGAKIKCKKVSGKWIKISGGWVCCGIGDDVYVK